jgi:hypothetical protein
VIEISVHNRNGGCGTRPITFSILALGVVALGHHRPKARGTDNALPVKSVACVRKQVNAGLCLRGRDDHSGRGYLFVQYAGFCLKYFFGTMP